VMGGGGGGLKVARGGTGQGLSGKLGEGAWEASGVEGERAGGADVAGAGAGSGQWRRVPAARGTRAGRAYPRMR